MEITDHLAKMLQLYKNKRTISMVEMAEELEISLSTLQDYMAGQGNPSVKTIEHLAHKMDVAPQNLISFNGSDSMFEVIVVILNMVQVLQPLSSSQKQQFAELFMQMVLLLSNEE